MASDLDPCEYCGREDFGNAGARTQHVRSCKEEAKKYQQNTQTEAQTPTIESAETGGSRSVPDRQQEGGEGIEQAGEQLAGGLSATLDEDAPLGQRKEGVKKLFSLASGAINGVMEQREQKARREEERAKNASLEEVDDKPECVECGLTFSRIPSNADRISCPECGHEYQVK